MIITQTPLRVSFLGGGSDYPEHFLEHGGATLVTAIDKYCLVSVHPMTAFDHDRFRVHYSRVESVASLDDIQHPSARECLRFLGRPEGLEIHYLNDLPARTGLGSSSSSTVGLLRALHAYQGRMVGGVDLAVQAIAVERDRIRERVGCQDQYTAALGGFLHLRFHADGKVHAEPLVLPSERLRAFGERLLLLYTGLQRNAHEILEEQLTRTRRGELSSHLCRLAELVSSGVRVLTGNGTLKEFGELLHEGWEIKRKLSSKVSNGRIDEYYETARRTGAIGGKLLGAGSGGFLLLFAEPEDHPRILTALPDLRPVQFQFERVGSTVIFYRP